MNRDLKVCLQIQTELKPKLITRVTESHSQMVLELNDKRLESTLKYFEAARLINRFSIDSLPNCYSEDYGKILWGRRVFIWPNASYDHYTLHLAIREPDSYFFCTCYDFGPEYEYFEEVV